MRETEMGRNWDDDLGSDLNLVPQVYGVTLNHGAPLQNKRFLCKLVMNKNEIPKKKSILTSE